MLLILLHTVYVLALSLAWGQALLRAMTGQASATLGLGWHLLAGWAGLTMVSSWLSFFMPLGGWLAPVLLSLGALLLGWRYRQAHRHKLGQMLATLRAWGWLPRLLMAALILVATARAAMPSSLFDEGLYYTSFIRWCQQYAVVPGLGNLHHRLAFNSHWHLLQAALDWTAFAATPLHDLNALLWVIMGGWAWDCLHRFWRGEAQAWDGFAVGWLWLSPHWLAFYTGPSADLPTLYLIWLVAWAFLRRLPWSLSLLLAAWAVTLKLSAAPLLLLPLYQALTSPGFRWRDGWRALGWVALLWLPWLGRFYVLSGHLVFPVGFTAWGQPDWQIPPEAVDATTHAIRAWARRPQAADYWQSLAEPLRAWLPRWWAGLSLVDQGLILAAGLLPLAGWPALAPLRLQARRDAVALGILALLGGIFWALQAPDPRFGYGWLVLTPWLWLGARLRAGRSRRLIRVGLVAIGLVAQVMSFRAIGDLQGAWLTRPAPATRPAVVSPPGGVAFRPATGDRCFDAPLPCTTENDGRFARRGTSWQAGFRPLPPPTRP